MAHEEPSLVKNVAIVTVLGAVARVLGFVVTAVIAAKFGAGLTTDAYYTALILPSVFVGIMGSVTKIVYIPVFVRERMRSPEEVPRILGSAVVWAFLASTAAVIVVVASARTGLFLPEADEGTKLLRADLLAILLAWLPLSAVSGVLSATYNSYQRFGLTEIAMLARHLVVAGLLLACAGRFGGRMLAISFLGGQVVVLVTAALGVYGRLRIRPCLTMSFHRALVPVLGMSAVTIAAAFLSQLTPMISRCVAAGLATGSISALSYAEKLAVAPTLFLGTGFVGVVLSHWSRMASMEKSDELQESLIRVVSFLIAVLVPLAIVLSVLHQGIVDVLLKRGAFDHVASVLTGQTFSVLILSIVPVYLHRTVVRAALAKQSAYLLLVIATVILLIHGALTWLLALRAGMGVVGIALSVVLSSAAGTVVGSVIVHSGFVPFITRRFMGDSLRVVCGCVVAVLADRLLGLRDFADDGLLQTCLVLAARFLAMGVLYGVTILVTGHRSVELLRRKATAFRNRPVE